MGKGTEVLVAVSIHLQSNPRQPFGRYKDKAAIQTSRPSPGTRIHLSTVRSEEALW